MAQLVLPVGAAEAQPPERLHHLRVHAGHLGIHDRLLTGLADHPVHLAAGVVHGVLDARRLDPTVLDQP